MAALGDQHGTSTLSQGQERRPRQAEQCEREGAPGVLVLRPSVPTEPLALPCRYPRGEAVVIVHLARPAPGLPSAEALEAEVGGLHCLQVLASWLQPQLGCPGERRKMVRVPPTTCTKWTAPQGHTFL